MVPITIRLPMRRHLRVWAICLLCGALSVSVACAQTREETLDFLLRDVVINDEYFDSSVPVSYYDKRHSSNFTITERDCVVTVSAYISGAFWNPGSGDEYYNNQPMSVTIDFSKLIFNDGTSQDIKGADADDGLRGGLKISIPGDEGAVTGWTLEWNGDEKKHRRLHWSQKSLILQFPPAKAPRALNAIRYFFSAYCKGDTRAF